MWILVLSLFIVGFEATRIIKYVTRFTEEIFATLIAFNFLLDVGKKCVKLLMTNPIYTAEKYCSLIHAYLMSKNETLEHCFMDTSNGDSQTLGYDLDCHSNFTVEDLDEYNHSIIPYPQPNKALLSLILIFVSFALAFCLRILRRSNFLTSSVIYFYILKKTNVFKTIF